MFLIYVNTNKISIYKEEGNCFDQKYTYETAGKKDIVEKILSTVRRMIVLNAKVVVFRGVLGNAIHIKDQRRCSKFTLTALRCIVATFFFYAKECIGLDKPGRLLQTIDGKRRYREGSATLVNIGDGDISFTEVRTALESELKGVVSEERKIVVEEALWRSLEILELLDQKLISIKKENRNLTIVIDSENHLGGFTAELRARIGRKDMPPIHGILK